MDPPENSVNRISRSIWTVWGYLSGAVARYLRPEVTTEGNQSVRARTDEIDLKSAVNKIDREVKTNNSDNENDRAEDKCSSSKVRAAASVQWENAGVVKSDNNDKLHVHTTKKQTYNCAAWSTGTETDSEGRTAEKVSSDEVQAEEEHANCESEERETTQELEVTGKTEQKDGDNKEECDENHEVEKCAEKREDADNTDVMVQSEQDVEQDKQMDHGETEDTGGLKHADEHPTDETEKQIIVQKNQGETENDGDQGTESQVQDLLKYLTDEVNGISKTERLQQIDTYYEEIADVSKNQIEEMMPGTGSATEQDEESQTAQDLEEIGRFEQKDGDSEERDQDREVEKCEMMREDQDNTDIMIQSEQDVEQDKQMDHGETEGMAAFKHADEHPTDETEKQIIVQKNQGNTENDEDQGTESQVQDLPEYMKDEANSISKPERLKQIDTHYEETADVSKNQIEEMMPGTGSATEQDEESQTAQDLEEIGRFEQKDGDSEEQIVVQKNQGKTENDEDQGTESQVQDLLEYLTDEVNGISKTERPQQIDTYYEEIADVSKNQIEEMMPGTGSATEQDEESQTAQDLEEIGRFEQKDGDSEERDQDREVEKCEMMREDQDNTDVMIQSEQDVEQDKQMDHGETEGMAAFKHADEHPTDETEKQIIVQKNQGKTENDEDQGTESQVQDLPEYMKDEANSISKPERLKQIDTYYEETADVSKNQIEEMMPGTGSATEQDEESQTAQDLEEIGRFEQKDGDSEEQIVVQKNQGKTENDEDQGTESQVQDLLEYLTDEVNGISKPERLKAMDKCSDEIDEFSKSGVEEMMFGTEQDEDTTDTKQDMTKYELIESTETLQRESESEKHASNDETELKMTTVADETVDALEDTLLSDSEQDTSENTPESGTGSSVLATKTEGIFSDLIVCEFPGESRRGQETDWGCFEEIQSKLHDPQSPAGERAERDSERSEKAAETNDTETLIQTETQQIDKAKLSLKKHVEFRTELIVETIETKISSEDAEAEAFETESQSHVIRNVSLQPHKLLEFTEGQCESSQGTMDTFSETLGNLSASEITGTAEHVSEDQTDVKLVSTRSLSPTALLEEPLDLQADVAKNALEYVEEITNQVVKEMIKTECNLVQKTEPLVELSTEEPGDAEHQAPALRVSADASVLEEERTLIAETMDSSEEHISSAECESTEADGHHEQIQKSIAGETVLRSHEDLMEVSKPGMKRGFDQVSKGLPEVKTEGKFDLILLAFEDSSLDFSVQKSRIAVKNPLVRPPKDPRKLLFRASAEPLPQPSDRSQTLQVSTPSKGMIRFKLPGLGAGLPVLRKTEFGQKAEAERTLQPQQKSVAVTEDSVKQEQVPAKPKWTPPKHPGMGSPFMMAELKNKLKKPVQE